MTSESALRTPEDKRRAPSALRRVARTLGVLAALGAVGLMVAAWVLRGPWVTAPDPVETRAASPERLRAGVRMLTETFHPRNYRHPENLDRAAEWIADGFREAGLAVEVQDYELSEGTFRNVLGWRSGSDPEAGLLVVGAHYDAYLTTPGADDNASGVVAVMELARLTGDLALRHDVLFAAFSTEEPPFFATEDMGSAHVARALAEGGEDVDLMVSLDLVGTFSDEPGSQSLPYPGMSLLYPTRGDFLAVTGDLDSGEAIALTKRGLLAARVLPVYSFRAPAELGYVDLSDHRSFWDAGYPAALVTNTAMLRNRRYHRPSDTWDTLDYDRLALVVEALQGVLVVADAEGDAEE